MSKTKLLAIITIVISIIIVGIFGGGFVFLSVGNQKEYTIVNVIVQTELQSTDTDNGYKVNTKYLYFCTTDSGEEIVFENEDNILFRKFNSSDILAKIKKYEETKTPFKIKTAGFRIGFLSMYQNIIEVE